MPIMNAILVAIGIGFFWLTLELYQIRREVYQIRRLLEKRDPEHRMEMQREEAEKAQRASVKQLKIGDRVSNGADFGTVSSVDKKYGQVFSVTLG
jgi:hypothetical protein